LAAALPKSPWPGTCGQAPVGSSPVRRPPLVLAFAILLAGCEVPSLGMPSPVSKEGNDIYSLWRGFIVASFVVGGIVVGLILYAAIRYRRRDDEVPSQNAYNIPIEIFYTVMPIVIVAGLFGFTVATQMKVTNPASSGQPALVVNVTGFQWGWRFELPEQHVTVEGAGEVTTPAIDVPVDRTVHFVLRTEDVNHAFWVPQFLEKRDLIQGIDNSIDITPTQVGEYGGKCAEFCGLDHWRMQFTIRVVTQGDFDAWVRSQPQSGR
jgi:cytochrome c oxidase subunit 2